MKFKFTIAALFLIFFSSFQAFCIDGFTIEEICRKSATPPIPGWTSKNEKNQYVYYAYIIKEAPEKYADLTGTSIYYDSSWTEVQGIGNMYKVQSLEDVNNAIKENNFYTMDFEGELIMCICNPTTALSFQEQKDFIYKLFKTKYAGFSDMKKKGFNKIIWDKAKDFESLKKIFDEYMDDNHFSIYAGGKLLYRHEQIFDEGTKKSKDPDYTFFSKHTPNTLYIRCTNCDYKWDKYKTLPGLAYEALTKDYVVLDFRSNCGGSDGEQYAFYNNLIESKYKGTVYILQDNWSYSSGEAWETASKFSDRLKIVVAGTHSGGMQNYGNVKSFTKSNFIVTVPTKKFPNLPSNYLGEGRGYEPDIWATTQNMAEVLSNQGLDLTGIEFK